MSPSLSTTLLHQDIEVACPECSYPVWVQLAEIAGQCFILCPCCRNTKQLLDRAGSVQTAGAVLEQRINNALKGLFR